MDAWNGYYVTGSYSKRYGDGDIGGNDRINLELICGRDDPMKIGPSGIGTRRAMMSCCTKFGMRIPLFGVAKVVRMEEPVWLMNVVMEDVRLSFNQDKTYKTWRNSHDVKC